MARKGIRVLGVARASLLGALPETQSAFAFRFLGLIGFADPLRSNVPAAIDECDAAGVRVVMITGDYPMTARAIAERGPPSRYGGRRDEEQSLSRTCWTVGILAAFQMRRVPVGQDQ